MHVVIFEGSGWKDLVPLALNRPAFALGAGTGTLLDKQLRHTKPTRLTLWVRDELAEWCRTNLVPNISVPTTVNTPIDDELTTIISGRSLHLTAFEHNQEPVVVVEENDVIGKAVVRNAAGLSVSDVRNRSQRWIDLLDLPRDMPQARFVTHAWELINWNEEALMADSMEWRDHSQPAKEGLYHLISAGDVLVEEGVKLSPGCVIDASKGPVMIGKGASIGPNAVVFGPCFIGAYSAISPCATIRAGTSIGPLCKVGGEVSNSIFFGCSNKAHEGFIGDSYIGKWVNLGAMTTTSNLKNTYGEIDFELGGKAIPTGQRFLGALIGDHSKTAIGTRLTTGSYVGFNSMVAPSGIAPKTVKSFSFLTSDGLSPFSMDKAIEVATRVLARRDRQFTKIESDVMHYVAKIAPSVE